MDLVHEETKIMDELTQEKANANRLAEILRDLIEDVTLEIHDAKIWKIQKAAKAIKQHDARR